MIGLCFLVFPLSAVSCSCTWRGPFLAVARDAPLVIHGGVVRHDPGEPPTMVVRVIETLKGGILDSGLIVQMGNGMLCRPTPEGFPPGSEWILALNGSGSEPGRGPALSLCGEYWLRVDNGEVIGRIDGTQSQVKRIPLGELKNKLHYPCFHETFKGRVLKGKGFHRPFGTRFQFILQPMPDGWEVVIEEHGRDENLARLTPPLHFAPNPRYIEGWHLSDMPSECATRSLLAEAAPVNPREFIFSPEVGRRVSGPGSDRAVTAEEIEDIRRFGRGTLTIEEFELQRGAEGCPVLEWIEFSVHLEGGC